MFIAFGKLFFRLFYALFTFFARLFRIVLRLNEFGIVLVLLYISFVIFHYQPLAFVEFFNVLTAE